MKEDKYYIEKIIKDIKFINKHMEFIESIKEFETNELLVDAMIFRIIQISENINKISEAFKTNYSFIPWKNIKGFRNRLVHEYGNVDVSFVFDALKQDIPYLEKQFKELIYQPVVA